jgi:rhodanese-related sulfurtransferase
MFPVETISAKMLDYYVGRSDSMIIDLREEEEYRAGHVKGARNIPYEQIEEGISLPRNKILVLYCDRGGASLKAARLLAAKGCQTRSVIGGFAAYRGRNLVISG